MVAVEEEEGEGGKAAKWRMEPRPTSPSSPPPVKERKPAETGEGDPMRRGGEGAAER